jgi:Fe2+ transport system protein B
MSQIIPMALAGNPNFGKTTSMFGVQKTIV